MLTINDHKIIFLIGILNLFLKFLMNLFDDLAIKIIFNLGSRGILIFIIVLYDFKDLIINKNVTFDILLF